MPSLYADRPRSDGKCSDVSESGHSSPRQPKLANPTNTFYFWVVILAVALIYNGYLIFQLQIQANDQRSQLENIFYQLNNLTSMVDHIVSSNDNSHLSRSKRHSSSPISFHKDHVQIGRVFRWVESNWTDSVGSASKKRRQVESIPDIGNGNKQPAVDFYPLPQPIDQTSRDYEWLTSYCRISLSVLDNACVALKKRCLPGLPGPQGKSGEKGDKGNHGVPGPIGPAGPTGIRGPPGEKGERGLDGVDGLPGEPGLDGTPGRDGRHGEAGQAGADGIAGRNGTDGKPGQRGEPGIPGIPGSIGPAGPRGKKGSPGIDGTPGIQVTAWRHNNSTLLIAPSIDDMTDKEQTITVKENENVRLTCVATGQPQPRITWRREDKMPIQIDGASNNLHEGSQLNITRIARDNMGSYLCVATNGVPPAATKKVNIIVTFPPLVKIILPRQMIGATKGSWVVLECYIEAYPEPFVQWVYGDSKVLVDSAKHNMSEEALETRLSETFSRRVVLNISQVDSTDFGLYKCEARNQRGRTYGMITLFESDVKTLPEEGRTKESTFVIYGEMPKLMEKTQCEPCPDCSQSSYNNQCKQGQRAAILNLGVSVLFNHTSWQPLSKRTNQCYLNQIGKPVFHSDYGSDQIGCWMRDPKPIKPEDEEKYWVTRVENNQLLQEFDSKEKFLNKLATRNYTLLHRFAGNAQTIYSGLFYYAEEGTSKLIIFNLDTLESAFLNLEPGVNNLRSSFVRKPSRHVRSHRRHRSNEHLANKRLYSNNLNKIDIAADENGIWLVYPNLYSEANHTVVMKLNSTRIELVWNLTVDYHKVGDTFIMCGILYGVDSLTLPSTHISFAYDLYFNEELKRLEQVEFTNPFMATQYIGYNARNQKLYTWDNGNILEYPLKIENKLNKSEDEE